MYHMKYMAVDNKVLFSGTSCVKGGKDFIALVLMATTLPGIVILWWDDSKIWLFPWIILSTATCRYGIKGILLCIVRIFPHYLCYVPAMVMLLQWCGDIYRSIYFYHNITGQGKVPCPVNWKNRCSFWGVLVSRMCVGSVCESCVIQRLPAVF